MRLRDGTSVWLTGASSGIGAALVRELAARGCRVAATARRVEKLEELAASATAGEVLPVPADVTDREAMLAAGDAVRERFGAIDLVILNAADWDLDVESWDTDVIRRHFDTNVLGMVHGIEAVLADMRRRRGGAIAGMASLAGYRGLPRSEAYGATKAAEITCSSRFGSTCARWGSPSTPSVRGSYAPT